MQDAWWTGYARGEGVMAVLNYHYAGHPEGAVNIMRPSKWGVPWRIARQKDKQVMKRLYRSWLHCQLASGEITVAELAELHGRDLLCCCAPGPCHGEVLEEWAEWAWREIHGDH